MIEERDSSGLLAQYVYGLGLDPSGVYRPADGGGALYLSDGHSGVRKGGQFPILIAEQIKSALTTALRKRTLPTAFLIAPVRYFVPVGPRLVRLIFENATGQSE